jgi:hypothetical protein
MSVINQSTLRSKTIAYDLPKADSVPPKRANIIASTQRLVRHVHDSAITRNAVIMCIDGPAYPFQRNARCVVMQKQCRRAEFRRVH